MFSQSIPGTVADDLLGTSNAFVVVVVDDSDALTKPPALIAVTTNAHAAAAHNYSTGPDHPLFESHSMYERVL